MNFFDVLYALREDTINGYLHSKHRQTDDIIRKIYNLIFVQSAKIKFRNRCPKSTRSIHIMVLGREYIKSKIVQQIHEYIPNPRAIP